MSLPARLPAHPGAHKAFSVPFESGHLLGTLVRQVLRDGLVALLHDFSDSGSTYVVPWALIPRTVVMTWFDGALHSRLAQLTRLSPSVIQDAANDVVAEGGAGDAARQDEMKRRDREEDRKTAMLEVLSAQALGQIGIDANALSTGGVSREQLDAACARHGLRSQDLAVALEGIVRQAMPLGIADRLGCTLEGPLRVTLRQLRQLSAHLERRGSAAGRIDRAHYEMVRLAAGAALSFSERIVGRYDDRIANLAPLLAGWKALEPEMARWILQLEMILDGWPQLIALNAGVIDLPSGAPGNLASILATIVPDLARQLAASQ